MYFWIGAFLVITVGFLIVFVLLLRLKKEHKIILEKKNRYFSKNIELTSALQNSYDHEEKILRDISNKLHDDVGSKLTSGLLLLNSLERNFHDFELDLSLRLKRSINDAITTVRSVSKDLYPPSLLEHGLTFAIHELCDYVTHPTIAIIRFNSEGEPLRLSKNHELILFRATQELINNAFKHSCAHIIEVTIKWEVGQLLIEVVDNGIGFPVRTDADRNREGRTGLKRVSYALEGINGSITFPFNSSKKGTFVRVKYLIGNS